MSHCFTSHRILVVYRLCQRCRVYVNIRLHLAEYPINTQYMCHLINDLRPQQLQGQRLRAVWLHQHRGVYSLLTGMTDLLLRHKAQTGKLGLCTSTIRVFSSSLQISPNPLQINLRPFNKFDDKKDSWTYLWSYILTIRASHIVIKQRHNKRNYSKSTSLSSWCFAVPLTYPECISFFVHKLGYGLARKHDGCYAINNDFITKKKLATGITFFASSWIILWRKTKVD